MKYISTKEAAEKWQISTVRVFTLIQNGRIPGAKLVGKSWLIPEDAEKPGDARKKKEKEDFLWPLPIYGNYNDDANVRSKEENRLLEAQKLVYRCRFSEALPILQEFLEPNSNYYLRIGALYSLSIITLAIGDYQSLKKNLNSLSFIRNQDFPHKTDCEAIFKDLRETIFGDESFFSSPLVDPDYEYAPEAIPYLVMHTAYSDFTNHFVKKSPKDPSFHELMCRQFENEGFFATSITLHIIIAGCYKMNGDKEHAVSSLRKAMKLVRKTGYIFIPVLYCHYIKTELEQAFGPEDSEYAEQIRSNYRKIKENYLAFLLKVKSRKSLIFTLSQEDYTLLHYARLGMTNKEVALEMQLSENTISKKYNKLFDKTNVNSKQQLLVCFEQSLYNADSGRTEY